MHMHSLIHKCTNIHIHVHTCTHTRTCTHMHAYMYMHTQTCDVTGVIGEDWPTVQQEKRVLRCVQVLGQVVRMDETNVLTQLLLQRPSKHSCHRVLEEIPINKQHRN